MPRGSGLNTIHGGNYQDADSMIPRIEESHAWWRELVAGETDPGEINRNQTTDDALESYVSRCDTVRTLGVPARSAKEPAEKIPEEETWWYYLDENFEMIELPEADN